MNGIRTGFECGGDQFLWQQVAVRSIGRPDGHGFVTRPYMQRITIRLGVNGYRAHALPTAGGRYAASDFAAIGDQYLVYHARHDGTVLFRNDLMPSRPHSVSHASARRSAV